VSGSVDTFGIAADGKGNIVIIGGFGGTIDFGGGPLTATGSYHDIFVASYDVGGAHRWSRSLHNPQSCRGQNVAVDYRGDVTITGFFQGTADFGDGLVSAVGDDVFVANYSSSGAHRWSKVLGGASDDGGVDVAVDGSGNVALTGTFQDTVDFGGGPLTSVGGSDIFLASYDPDGTHRWSKGFGSLSDEDGKSVAASRSGNVTISGRFKEGVDFGGGLLASPGKTDTFMATYDATGVHQWSKRLGGEGMAECFGEDLAVDTDGNIATTGCFTEAVDFGGGPLTSIGLIDVFLASYTPSGAHRWSKRFGHLTFDKGQGVAVDSAGNIFVTGSFEENINLGGGQLLSDGAGDLFVGSFDMSGLHRWSKRFGGSTFDRSFDLAVDPDGNVVATGSFGHIVDFGGGPLTASGTDTVSFILQLAPPQ